MVADDAAGSYDFVTAMFLALFVILLFYTGYAMTLDDE